MTAGKAGVDLRGRTLARDSGYNLLGQGLPLLVALVAVPILLRSLGEARFGVLGLAWMFVVFLGEVGLGRAVTRYAAVARARVGAAAVRRIVRTGALVQLALGVAVGLALAALTPWLVDRVLGVPAVYGAETRAALLWLAVGAPAILVAAAHRGGLEAAQRFDLVNLIRGSAAAANFLLPLAALALGWGLGGIVALLVGSRAAVALLYVRALGSAVPTPVSGTSAPASPDEAAFLDEVGVRALLRFGGWISLSALVSPVLTYLDRAILAAVAGVEAVGRYTPPWEAIIRLGLIPASVMTALFPVFSAVAEGDDPARLRRLAFRGGGALLVLTGLPALVAALWAEPLLGMWLGDGYHPEGARALRILALGVVLNAVAYIPLGMLQGANRPELPALLHLVELPVQVVLAWLLVSRFGVAGAAMAWSARSAMDSVGLWALALWTTRGRADAPASSQGGP